MQKAFKLLILTEAGIKYGFGHITRCISLCDSINKENINIKILINGDNSVHNILEGYDYKICNWIENIDEINYYEYDIVIIDSYNANKPLYQKIAKKVKISVYFDDYNRIEYPDGIVINGSIHANFINYPKNKNITYLTGKDYIPVRKEFWDIPVKKINNKIEQILITMGGNDLRNLTPQIVKLLAVNFKNIRKNIIVNENFRNIEEIKSYSDPKTFFFFSPDANSLKEIMLQSDIAISAAGQTLYELARTGTPTIMLSIADNQSNNVKGWTDEKLMLYSGNYLNCNYINNILENIINIMNKTYRLNISTKLQSFIDGNGSKRIIDSILCRII